MSTPRPFKLSATAVLAATTLAALSSPAGAVPVTTYILESDANLSGLAAAAAIGLSNVDPSGPNISNYQQYLNNDGLIFNQNISGAEVDQISATNAALLGATVDALGKINIGGAFESFHPAVTDPDALTLSCADAKCSAFDWTFDQSKTTLAVDWEIVKIGVKYGNLLAYFLVDGDGDTTAEANDGAISGHFDIFDYVPDAGDYLTANLPAPTLLDGVFQIADLRERGDIVGKRYTLNGLSHIDFFGTPNPQTDVPEPGALGLLGLGLAGIGLIARRRRTA